MSVQNKPKVAPVRPDCQAGLNDNLGRELLELHTVSVAAGYTEEDIKAAANVLAGWGIDFGEELPQMRKTAGGTRPLECLQKALGAAG